MCARREAGAHRPAPSTPAASSRPESRPGRFRTRLSFLLPAFALLLGALGLFDAAPAAADVLVSNIGQTADTGVPTDNHTQAQAFGTGSNAGGYTLTSIEAVVVDTANNAERATIRAELWSATTNGAPNAKLASLTVPSTVSAGTVSFAAPAGTTLSASTTYFFVVYTDGDFNMKVGDTTSTSVDQGGQAGWSIGSRYATGDTPATDSTWAEQDSYRVRIRVNAAVNVWSANLTVEANHDQRHGLGASPLGCADWALVADGVPKPAAYCEPTGALTDDDFTYRSVDYSIEQLTDGNSEGALVLTLDKTIPESVKDSLVLVVGGQKLALADGDLGTAVRDNDSVGWENTGRPTWTVGDVVPVSLEEAATRYVSNTGQSSSGFVGVSGSSRAQAFTTGSSPNGYILAGVEVRLRTTSDLTANDIETVKAEVWSDSSGVPGTKLEGADLTVPSDIPVGENDVAVTLADPAGTELASGTTYHVVLYSTGNLGKLAWHHTGADAEDAGAAANWSIADTRRQKSANLPTANTPGWVSASQSLRIAVDGYETPAAPGNLSVEGGPERLDLAWTEPSGTVTGYDVHYTSAPDTGNDAVGDEEAAEGSDPSEAWVAVARSGDRPAQTIADLTNDAEYRVRVRAKNPGGAGPWTQGDGTPEAWTWSPQAAERELKENNTTRPRINLSRAAPAGGLTFTATLLFGDDVPSTSCTNDSGRAAAEDLVANWPTTLTVPGGKTEGEVAIQIAHDLVSESAECFTVQFAATQATMDAGWTGPDDVANTRTDIVIGNTVPLAKPTDLDVLPVINGLNLHWTAPDAASGDGAIGGYDVHYTSSTTVGNDAAALSSGGDAATGWVAVSRSGDDGVAGDLRPGHRTPDDLPGAGARHEHREQRLRRLLGDGHRRAAARRPRARRRS